MDSDTDFYTAFAALDWQLDMGVTEAIGDAPVDRYALAAEPVKTAPKPGPVPDVTPRAQPPQPATVDAVAVARAAAAGASDLTALNTALQDFAHCDLKKGARNTVFADGRAGAPVMIIGEAPGRDEDIQGKPFVGRAGQLLDRMLAAIGLSRDAQNPGEAVYITNVLPWRPPQNREPTPQEMAMMVPFLERHIDLAAPKILVLMGNTPCQALLGRRGITRMRGTWTTALSLPVMPMTHPAYLLRTPAAKRDAWADLLAIKARLRG